VNDFARFANAVTEASRRAEVREAIASVYDDVSKETETQKPVCVMSGRCCRFEEFGHRLYVTTIETAAFVSQLAPGHDRGPNGCPFQVGKICGVHAIRPFGCRIFFCDSNATEWQRNAYERFHARIKRLHEQLDVPYFYVEWREALRAIEHELNEAKAP
jgi:Fe-S-cluster containining protein